MPELLHRWQGPIAALVTLAVILPGLGTSGLLDPWEMDRASVARVVGGTPQVLVIDEDRSLLKSLDAAAGDALALRRLPTSGEGAAATALSRAPNELGERVHHAVIIDADAVLKGRPGDAGYDHLASQTDSLRSANRGTLIALVSDQNSETLGRKLAMARARLWQSSRRTGWLKHMLPPAKDAAKLWPMWWQDDTVYPRKSAAKELVEACPSPWWMVQHKANGTSAQAPLLDTWFVALSMRILGPSELSARLPGALVTAAVAWLSVSTATALFGAAGGWLTLLVLLTLPLAVGSARLVTLTHTASLGTALVAFGAILSGLDGPQRKRWWWLAVVIGLDILLLGRGLGGLSIGVAMLVGYVIATRDRNRVLLGVTAAAVVGLALSTWVVLADETSPWLRSLRFTQVPFSGGMPVDRRDLAELISHLGFGLYPWGPIFLIGCGRLLFTAGNDVSKTRRDVGLLIGFGAPVLGAMVLLPDLNHSALPVAALVAVMTAGLLVDVLAGRVHGAVLALLIIVPALLLHREIGKEAGALVRWLAFDPPLGDDKAAYTWPQELTMSKGLRRLTLLLTIGFALALARPVQRVVGALQLLQSRRATLWTMTAVGVVYALDVLISLGTRLDVLLRGEATRTGYNYDRVWTTIQMTRPEVVAGAAAFVALLVGTLLVDFGNRRGWSERRWVRLLRRISGLFARTWLVLAAVGGAAIAVLVNGAIVLTQVQRVGLDAVALEGLTSAAFIAPVVVAVGAAVLLLLPRFFGDRHEWAAADRDTTWSKLLAAVQTGGWTLVVALALLAAAGIGIGASQAAGTWTYGYLAACWALAVAVVLSVGGNARGQTHVWAAAGLAAAILVSVGVWAVLMGRLIGEPRGPGISYAARVLLLAPDAFVLLAVLAGLAINRLAVRHGGVGVVRRWALGAMRLGQRPAAAVTAICAAAMFLAAGYAYGLLPGMSLHFSQKHLLARVDAAGGTVDDHGVPRTFKHATGTRSSIQTNFYTRAMPTIADRDAVMQLLAGEDVGTRVSDYGDLGRSLDLAIEGWDDKNDADKDKKRDKPAFFGVAKKVEGLSVTAFAPRAGDDKDDEAETPKWKADQWKGARLHMANGRDVLVLGNDAATLRLAAPTSLVAGDVRRGAFSLDMNTDDGAHRSSSAVAGGRFVVLAKEQFSELNHVFRSKRGRHIAVLDARSSRLVLAASRLPEGFADENWLKRAVLTDEALAKLPGLTKVNVNWDNRMEMVAYHLKARSVRRSQKYVLTLYLKIHKALPHSYKIFMHPHPLHRDLWPLAYKRETKATEKRCSGCFQSNHWRPGDIIAVPIEQEVPLGTTAGPQDIILGWYDPLSDKRLQLISARGPGVVKHRDNRVTLTKLQVR